MEKPTTRRYHGCCGKGTHISKKDAKYWNIPLNSLLDHLNGKNSCRKMSPQSMLIE